MDFVITSQQVSNLVKRTILKILTVSLRSSLGVSNLVKRTILKISKTHVKQIDWVSNLVKRTILKIFCGGDIEEEESVT